MNRIPAAANFAACSDNLFRYSFKRHLLFPLPKQWQGYLPDLRKAKDLRRGDPIKLGCCIVRERNLDFIFLAEVKTQMSREIN